MSRSLLTTLAVLDGIYSPQPSEYTEVITADRVTRTLHEHPLALSHTPAETIAAFLECELPEDKRVAFEQNCEENPILLAEIASLHRIITKQLRNPAPSSEECRHRLYAIPAGLIFSGISAASKSLVNSSGFPEVSAIPSFSTAELPELPDLSKIDNINVAKNLLANTLDSSLTESLEKALGESWEDEFETTKNDATSELADSYKNAPDKKHEIQTESLQPLLGFRPSLRATFFEMLNDQKRILATLVPLFAVVFIAPILWKSGILGNRPQPEQPGNMAGTLAGESTQLQQGQILVDLSNHYLLNPGVEPNQFTANTTEPVPPPPSSHFDENIQFVLPDVNEFFGNNELQAAWSGNQPNTRIYQENEQSEEIRLAVIPQPQNGNRVTQHSEQSFPEPNDGRYGPYSDPWSFAPMSHTEEIPSPTPQPLPPVE